VRVKAGQTTLASAAQGAPPVTSGISPARAEIAETSGSVIARAEQMPPQPANHGTGHGLLGVLPASSLPAPQAVAAFDAAPRAQPQAIQQNGAIKPVIRSGWIIPVGALETES